MPILTSDLRSPEERRSDQLTILRRRAPPPRSAGRFFKIIADTATAIRAFDPTFDSDADTDGPTSGSSIWRRELSRVRSSSSTSIGLLVDDKRLPSFEKRFRQDSDGRFDRVPSRKESDDSFVFDGFVRDRVTSFYGKANDVEVAGEGISPVSEKTLRHDLEDDYDMFYRAKGKAKGKGKEKGKENQQPNEQAEHAVATPEKNTTNQPTPSEEVAATPKKKKTSESTRSEESDKTPQSLESGVGSAGLESGQEESLRTLKQFRLHDDPDRFTVSIVSDENSDDELEDVSGAVAYQCGRVPLFVEEIGRVPRAAIIDGKFTRVRVSPEKGSFREAVSRARRSSFGWGLGREGWNKEGWWRRRRSAASGLRRSGWWRMRHFLFRHGSEFDAREV